MVDYRKTSRTDEQQKYRDELASKLRDFRSMGNVGDELANTFLEQERKTKKYKEANLNSDNLIELYPIYTAENLDKIKGVNHAKLAKKLLEDGEYSVLLENLKKFRGIDNKALLTKIIEEGHGYCIGQNLDQIIGVDWMWLFDAFAVDEYQGLNSFVRNLNKIEGVDEDFFMALERKLEKLNRMELVADGLEHFKHYDDDKIRVLAYKLAKSDDEAYVHALFRNLEKFGSLKEDDYRNLVDILIDKYAGCLLSRIHLLKGLENDEEFHERLARNLLDQKWSPGIYSDYDCLRKLKCVDSVFWQTIARRAIYNLGSRLAFENIDVFKGIDYFELIDDLLNFLDGEHSGMKDYHIGNLINNIKRLNAVGVKSVDIAKKLIENGYSDYVSRYSEKFGLKKK